MQDITYKTVPAPRKPRRIKGVKGAEAQFAHVITDMINAEAAQGWMYAGTERFEVDTKSGLFGKAVTRTQTLLIFYRERRVPRAEVQMPEPKADEAEPRAAMPAAPQLGAATE